MTPTEPRDQMTVNVDGSPQVLLTLRRGLQVLEAIARSEGSARAKEIADSTSIGLATCYQILRTLRHDGYVTRVDHGRYQLGPRCALLAEHYRRHGPQTKELRTILERLHADLNETTYLTIRDNSAITVNAFLVSTRALRVEGLEVGYSGHPHARASCKAVLAFLPRAEVDRYLSSGSKLTQVTPHTIASRRAFDEELEATHARGYAIDREEFKTDVGCVSAAFFDRDGLPRGSLTVAVPIHRLAAQESDLAARTQAAAADASRHLGWSGRYPPR